MLGLAAVLSVIGIFAVWANRQLLDTSYWTETNTALLENHAIQEQLSSYLTEQLYANVDVAGEIRSGLPSELKPLAGPAAGGLRSLVEKGIVIALQRPRVQELWKTANEVTHKQFVNLIENKGRVIRTPGGGAVILDLRPIVSDLATRLGAPASTAEKIPANVAEIKIISSKSLETAQAAVRVLRGLALILPLLVLLLFAGAIGLARGRRSRTLVNVGLVCIGAGLVALVARTLIGNQVVDTLATHRSRAPRRRAPRGRSARACSWTSPTQWSSSASWSCSPACSAGARAGRQPPAARWPPTCAIVPTSPSASSPCALLILFAWGPIDGDPETDRHPADRRAVAVRHADAAPPDRGRVPRRPLRRRDGCDTQGHGRRARLAGARRRQSACRRGRAYRRRAPRRRARAIPSAASSAWPRCTPVER